MHASFQKLLYFKFSHYKITISCNILLVHPISCWTKIFHFVVPYVPTQTVPMKQTKKSWGHPPLSGYTNVMITAKQNARRAMLYVQITTFIIPRHSVTYEAMEYTMCIIYNRRLFLRIMYNSGYSRIIRIMTVRSVIPKCYMFESIMIIIYWLFLI